MERDSRDAAQAGGVTEYPGGLPDSVDGLRHGVSSSGEAVKTGEASGNLQLIAEPAPGALLGSPHRVSPGVKEWR